MKSKYLLFTTIGVVALLLALNQLRLQGSNPLFAGTFPSGSTPTDEDGSSARSLMPQLTVSYDKAEDANSDAPAPKVEIGSRSEETSTSDEQLAATSEPELESNAKMGAVIHDFRGFRTGLDGFIATGLKATEYGLELTDDAPAEQADDLKFRRGTLESPAIPMNFPSNGVQPIWRVNTPEGTTFHIEMAVSSEQDVWGDWQPVTATGDEILPIRSDGSPNPNHGAASGVPLLDGQKLFPFVRYRITLTSANNENPRLEEMKLSYLDSTLGTGRIAQSGEYIELPKHLQQNGG